jgi:hypothetical protein
MEKIEQKSDATNASTSAESRAALMLLGRRAITEQPTTKQKLSLAFLRRKVLHQQEEAGEKITDLDQLFLSATSVRLDSCDIHAIENLEMLDKLQHVHLQNNYITAIEELDFCKHLTWLNLSRNKIQTIQGLSQLKELTCLDLSSNDIASIDNVSSLLPSSLRVFSLYGNPVAEAHAEYRTTITSMLPNLVAFDGTCICDKPEDAPGFSPEDELFGCDGKDCNARVIFGPRFVTGVNTGAECDYCIACAYRAVVHCPELDGHGYVLSSDAGRVMNPTLAAMVQQDQEDPIAILKRSAVEARVELRNHREQIMQKIRARKTQTSIAATKRMELLKKLDDHIAMQERKKKGETLKVEEAVEENYVQEGKSEGGSSSRRRK